ncbi:hypothetical protein EJ05DRAFT_474949 [Pseudovirgaria hyperparasitica]|uniref:Uncharacterized protein n=1 Tax=Pseudovirgaria hyperparasitica TaxID=470096 RepID=A0A6A6WCY2_9PEZI|nr:uncharacterized protein EJ05DRAFT_474949 [Pseudovirgaria hyperparasitica]KAF2759914.1 hypothetical protein EJ05DRAFT_474949 [Pseudovirgaria hyperparasitica]
MALPFTYATVIRHLGLPYVTHERRTDCLLLSKQEVRADSCTYEDSMIYPVP